MDYLEDIQIRTVIRKLKAHFARYGIPHTLYSVNGAQHTAEEFKTFSTKLKFKRKTSFPGHPQSNGKAESPVKTHGKGKKKDSTQSLYGFVEPSQYHQTNTEIHMNVFLFLFFILFCFYYKEK